jgi:tetratricopeptide (TPR) repeat protein
VTLSSEGMSRISNALSIYLGAIFLAYCAVFLQVCPSLKLFTAVMVEVAVFGMSVLMLYKSPLQMRWKIFDKVTSLMERHGWLTTALASCRAVRMITLCLVTILVTCDFTAFCSAAFFRTPLTVTMYSVVPASRLVGLHPAATLEMLAGAFVESKHFESAEPLYFTILEVRKCTAGSRSDLVAALYTDLGDLNIRKNSLPRAEQWYRESIKIGQGSGRALTGLATTLREEGQFSESKLCYLQALKLRSAAFGTASKQYHDTLRGYETLMQKSHASGT